MAGLDDDVFRVLGVPRDADAAAVKRAYRERALRDHPDRHPGDDAAAAERFAALNRAYAAWSAAQPDAPATSGVPLDTQQIFDAFGDLFGEFFGGTGKPGRGGDLRQPLKITPTEARDGVSREIAIARKHACTRCRGTGADDGVVHPCTVCRGTGQRRQTQGALVIATPCGACVGGQEADAPCDHCDRGFVERRDTIVVKVPAGVLAGQQLRLAGKGHDGTPGSEPGHLYLVIEIATFGVLERRGDDAVIETPVTSWQRWFGGTTRVPTVDGHTTRVRIPRDVHDGATTTLVGRGYVRTIGGDGPYRGTAEYGDQRVVFRVPTDAPRTLHAPRPAALAMLIGAIVIAVLYALR